MNDLVANAGANLALLPLLLARRTRPSKEEELLHEIRELALDEVSRDLETASQSVAAVGAQVKGLISGESHHGESLSSALAFAVDLLSNLQADKVPNDGKASRPTTEV